MDDDSPQIARPGDVLLALALLSRLPLVRDTDDDAQTRSAAAVWAYPLAGAAIGALAALAGLAAGWLGLPPALSAVAVLAASVILTGALHEDGLADTADGLWGGWDRDRRLEIMRDSRIGAYGVIALVLSLLARWAALAALIGAGWMVGAVIAAAALSRAPMAGLMAGLPNARSDGLSARVGRPPASAAWLAAAVAAAIGLILAGTAALTAGLAILLVALLTARIAQSRIGGQTGDILGATQQLCEIAALACFAAAVS